ncbi:MAG: hypothetical protein HYV26_16075, partial [Candidatus Hydrogenedentes bacterium]|nr:hypothetical protein [Candidatus Hydrogenedentota bacterium]
LLCLRFHKTLEGFDFDVSSPITHTYRERTTQEEFCEERLQDPTPWDRGNPIFTTSEATETKTLDFILLISEGAAANLPEFLRSPNVNLLSTIANFIYARSDTKVRLELKGTIVVPLAEEIGAGTNSEDIANIVNARDTLVGNELAIDLDVGLISGNSLSATARLLREEYSADFVALMIEGIDASPDVRGIAGSYGVGAVATEAFVVFERGPAESVTFAHEVAHLLGANHVNERGLFAHSSGWQLASLRTTIMSGGFPFSIGLPIPRFSNPDQLALPGLPLGDEDCADNARTLRKTITVANRWRDGASKTVEVRNSDGTVLMRLYQNGLVVLRGSLIQNASDAQLQEIPGSGDMLIAGPDRAIARLDAATGDLYIGGTLFWAFDVGWVPLRLHNAVDARTVGLDFFGNLYTAENVLVQDYSSF